MLHLRSCIAAFRFLTVLPLPGSFGAGGDDLRGALPWFPLVGLALGAVASAAAWLSWQFLPVPVAAVLLTSLLLFFSGAMHLDGLADTADGFFSARGRAEMLAIMRDSRIGVMGVAAVVLVLLLKVACLGSMSPAGAVRACLLMPIAGRCALVLLTSLLPYVRTEGGLATTLYAGRSLWTASVALAALVLVGHAFLGPDGIIAAAAAILGVLLFAAYCRRKIGGVTGDTLGAACELAEVSVAFSLASSDTAG